MQLTSIQIYIPATFVLDGYTNIFPVKYLDEKWSKIQGEKGQWDPGRKRKDRFIRETRKRRNSAILVRQMNLYDIQATEITFVDDKKASNCIKPNKGLKMLKMLLSRRVYKILMPKW